MTPVVTIPGRRTRMKKVASNYQAVGYLRVSTGEQVESGAGLEAQKTAITAYAERMGIFISHWSVDAGISGGLEPAKRAGLSEALELLETGEVGVLIAAKLDRLSRSVRDAVELLDRAERGGWNIATADGTVGGDNSPMGKAMVGISSVFAQLERELISTRTKEALATRRAQGMKLGQPTTLPDAVLRRIVRELSEGKPLRAIASGLERDGIATAQGKTKWYAAQIKRAAESLRGQEITREMFGTD